MSNNGASYVRSLKSVNAELKRISEHAKKLKREKKATEERLYKYMCSNDLKEFEGYKRDKLKPKEKIPTIKRKKKEKVAEGIRLLTMEGIADPQKIYEELMKSQKPVPITEAEQ